MIRNTTAEKIQKIYEKIEKKNKILQPQEDVEDIR